MADLILSEAELAALTGYRRAHEQLAELHRRGFSRARRDRLGRVVLERAALFAGQQPLEGRHVTLALRHQGGGRSVEAQAAHPGWRRSLEQVKREHIRQVLEGTGFNIAVASTILGISRSALYGYRRAWYLGGP